MRPKIARVAYLIGKRHHRTRKRVRIVLDRVDEATRSAIMSKVRSKNTRPEMTVRRPLHKKGYRFRLNRSDLPGRPDLVFPRYRVALFVHGCFWHRHGCDRSTMPKSNVDYWADKFQRNVERDCRVRRQLEESGWRTSIIWECDLEAGIVQLSAQLSGIAGSKPAKVRQV